MLDFYRRSMLTLAWVGYFVIAAPWVALAADTSSGEGGDFGTCSEPTIEISWFGYDDAKLEITADPAQRLSVDLYYLDPRVKIGTFDTTATAKGTTIPITLKRGVLLKSGGQLYVHYKAVAEPAELEKICAARREGPADPAIRAIDKHLISFDVGVVNNLRGDGSWENNAEAAFSGSSRWHEWLLVGFDARYSAIGADEPEDAADGDGMEDPDGSGDTTPDEAEPFDPFAAGGGVFEGSIYAVLSLPDTPRFGLVIGGGFTTLPGAADNLETRQRLFAGFRVSVEGYNAGRPGDSLQNTNGFIAVGIAQDDLWEEVVLSSGEEGEEPIVSDESKRVFLKGELELPRIGSNWFRTVVRLHASIPSSGDGPSDIRVSVLGSIDPTKWFNNGNGN